MGQRKELSKTGQEQKTLRSIFAKFLAAKGQNFISGKESELRALSPPNFENFLIFPNFL